MECIAVVNIISYTCAFLAAASQKICCKKVENTQLHILCHMNVRELLDWKGIM